MRAEGQTNSTVALGASSGQTLFRALLSDQAISSLLPGYVTHRTFGWRRTRCFASALWRLAISSMPNLADAAYLGCDGGSGRNRENSKQACYISRHSTYLLAFSGRVGRGGAFLPSILCRTHACEQNAKRAAAARHGVACGSARDGLPVTRMNNCRCMCQLRRHLAGRGGVTDQASCLSLRSITYYPHLFVRVPALCGVPNATQHLNA